MSEQLNKGDEAGGLRGCPPELHYDDCPHCNNEAVGRIREGGAQAAMIDKHGEIYDRLQAKLATAEQRAEKAEAAHEYMQAVFNDMRSQHNRQMARAEKAEGELKHRCKNCGARMTYLGKCDEWLCEPCNELENLRDDLEGMKQGYHIEENAKLGQALCNTAAELRDLKAVHTWTPVAEGVPDHADYVLLMVSGKRTFGTRGKDGWWIDEQACPGHVPDSKGIVTHWAELLPAPPEETKPCK